MSAEIILTLETGAMQRWRDGDPGGWAELAAPDLTYVDPGLVKPILDLEGYKAYLALSERLMLERGAEIIDPKVALYGDAAVVTYLFRSTSVAPQATGQSQGLWNATTVYFRLDGNWKIVHMHRSYLNHRQPEAVEVPIPVELEPREYQGVLGELMALESAAMERWRKGDPWGFVEIYAPEVTYFDTGTPRRLDGREVLRAEYARREGQIHYDVMEFIDPRVQVCGDAAVLLYRFLSTVLRPDGAIAERMPWNCTEVYARRAGAWQIVHNHWSLIKGERT